MEVLEKVLKGKRLKPNTERHCRDALGSLARYSEDWPVSSEVVPEASIGDLVGDMFPKVREGVAVRKLLKYEDLLLLRRVLVWYASYDRSSNDAVRARELMKRMLRKGGSEFYSKRK